MRCITAFGYDPFEGMSHMFDQTRGSMWGGADTDVTVDSPEHATDLTRQALADAGYDAESTEAERQLSVWVIDAAANEESLTVYLDPVTQRTSIVSHA